MSLTPKRLNPIANRDITGMSKNAKSVMGFANPVTTPENATSAKMASSLMARYAELAELASKSAAMLAVTLLPLEPSTAMTDTDSLGLCASRLTRTAKCSERLLKMLFAKNANNSTT